MGKVHGRGIATAHSLKFKETVVEGVPKKELSLFDSICIIVGIIIGAGIYETAPIVAKCLGCGPGLMLVWLAGGLLALTGALCYAELATAYPREGGDYVYLTRADGRWPGYMFGWSQLAIVRPGDIALMAFIFARYAQTLYAPFGHSDLIYAASAIVLLTVINILGVKAGKWTQNLLTVTKILGLVAISVVGLMAPPAAPLAPESGGFTWEGLQLAFILVFFTFGGWNEMAYVAAEIKRPRQNIVRALVLGTVAVTALYLLINGAFLSALGLSGLSSSQAVAVEMMGRFFLRLPAESSLSSFAYRPWGRLMVWSLPGRVFPMPWVPTINPFVLWADGARVSAHRCGPW